MVNAKANTYNIDPKIIAATILTESFNNPWIPRFEPAYKWLYYPRILAEKFGCALETMEMMQRTSWGLMHVMGATFYELGGDKEIIPFPTIMINSEDGIEYGSRYLKKLQQKYGDDPSTLAAAYNAGSPRLTKGGLFVNQRHVDRFTKHYRSLE